jgi:L-cystine uptake protein TcyP (sodium:dicarboxylate symporter family)
LKLYYFLIALLIALITTSCIPAAIGMFSWYSLTIKDEKQILADKSECEQIAIKIIENRKDELSTHESTDTKISVIDQIFQQEFTACMKAKDYYKVAAKPKP